MAEIEQAPSKPRWWTRKWAIGVAGLLVGAAMAQAGGGSASSTASPGATPAPTVTVTAPAGSAPTVTATVTAEPETVVETVTAAPAGPAAAIAENGTFIVGTEIKAGTYKATAESMCYWARLSGLSGELTDVITNHLGEGATVVTIKKTDKAFETRDCGEWKKIG